MHPRFLITLTEDLKPLPVNVRVGQAVDVVGQAGRPKTITGWQTQNTPVLLAYGERAELEDDQFLPLSHTLEGLVILRVCIGFVFLFFSFLAFLRPRLSLTQLKYRKTRTGKVVSSEGIRLRRHRKSALTNRHYVYFDGAYINLNNFPISCRR